MVDTEIWLRLMSISSLYGDDMVRIAHWVAKQSHIDAVVLQQTGLTLRQAQRFLSFPRKSIESSLCWLEQPNHHLIPADSEFYPPQLLATTDYPGALFVEGELHALHSFQLAVVGSRAHSWYGERWGRLFCETLATRGVTITSGLARGIDGVAHKAALQVNGVSIAVLGNGLNTIHPRRHARLAASLLEQGGALVSEFPLDVPPLAYNFPRRNRIISGLSKGVLVVEAALRSGSLVTARCALEQGREVFALPGPIGNPGSEGPHWLIKQGAILVTEPEEILEKLADYQEGLAEPMQLASDPLSMRIYTPEECERLDASCRGFLLFLEQIQVLNLETREMVIERVLALDNAEFELDDLKWVILMVLFNIPGCENAYQQMEELLFEVNEGMLH
ncbi:DNA-protecting protein DprA [Escherichia coli]|nr:DNA-protecting protein DprA [Escherichia coli]